MQYVPSASTIHITTNNKANFGPTCSTKSGEINNKILLSHFQKYPSTMQGNSKINNHPSLPNYLKCMDFGSHSIQSRSMGTVYRKLFDRF